MQSDMHFYGVYALCRMAGIYSEAADIIAHSSQLVDDALGDDILVFLRDKKAILPTKTSHKPLDYKNVIEEDQWRVWIAFHFLPGNNPNAKTFEEKIICSKNSKIAQKILEYALINKRKNFSPYLAGIVSHVFADTFAHYGFLGFSSKLNLVRTDSIVTQIKAKNIFKYVNRKLDTFFSRIKGTIAETLPIGHGAVATLPDRPYLQWEYRYKFRNGKKVKRLNWKDYLECSEKLYRFYVQWIEVNPGFGSKTNAVAWNTCKSEIEKILRKEGSKKNRILQWKKAISSGKLFPPNSKDKNINYNSRDWFLSKKQKKELKEKEILKHKKLIRRCYDIAKNNRKNKTKSKKRKKH